jgi:hypothetical protein
VSLLALLQVVLFLAGTLALTAAIVELRQGRRLLAHPERDVHCTVQTPQGALNAPLTNRPCASFTLTLSRRRVQERMPGGVLVFAEARPFTLAPLGRPNETIAVDPEKRPVVLLGFEPVQKPLPHLPTAIVGLLVQRFGKRGYLWAEDYAVTARESALTVGLEVHAFVEDGMVRLLSARPLQETGRAAWKRGLVGVGGGIALVLAAATLG